MPARCHLGVDMRALGMRGRVAHLVKDLVVLAFHQTVFVEHASQVPHRHVGFCGGVGVYIERAALRMRRCRIGLGEFVLGSAISRGCPDPAGIGLLHQSVEPGDILLDAGGRRSSGAGCIFLIDRFREITSRRHITLNVAWTLGVLRDDTARLACRGRATQPVSGLALGIL
jgi:hypothetical protein